LAESRPSLYVYALPDDPPGLGEEQLRIDDFREVNSLVSMVADAQPGEGADLVEAKSIASRDAVSSFMAGIFFPHQERSFRETVRASTTTALSLELHSLESDGRIAGAVMLSRSPGMLGIYNLSVANSKRGRGVGSSIVRWCHGVAAQEDRKLTIQCESGLEQWYSSFGFRPLGRIKVFSLLRPGCIDIMESGLVP
jgi:predicted N-acetyltransferase YhbS